MKRIYCALTLQLWMPCALLAQPTTTSPPAAPAHVQPQPMTEGEIRRIDTEAKKLTIRHGPIRNLDMPAMTMVFQVKDSAMLDKLNAGDKIRFWVEKINGSYVVTELEVVK